MSMSETRKKQLRYIRMLWIELGHEPGFKEFDDDPRTPKANSLSYEFGSYSSAVEVARRYLNHPELLEPDKDNELPQKPLSTLKDKGKASKQKSSSTSRVTPIPQNTIKKYTTPVTKSANPTQASLPAMSWKQTEVTPLPPVIKAAPKPVKKALETPKPKETPKPPSEPEKAVSEPEKAPEEKSLNANTPFLINYLYSKIALISSDQYLTHTFGEPTDHFTYQTVQRSEYIAKTETTSFRTNVYHAKTNYIIFDVPILKVSKRPILARNNYTMDLPDPRPNTLLIVGHEVAIAARDSGRTVDDLVFPITYYEQDGICYCCELGRL